MWWLRSFLLCLVLLSVPAFADRPNQIPVTHESFIDQSACRAALEQLALAETRLATGIQLGLGKPKLKGEQIILITRGLIEEASNAHRYDSQLLFFPEPSGEGLKTASGFTHYQMRKRVCQDGSMTTSGANGIMRGPL